MPRQLLSSGGQLFELSDAAARQSLWLKGLPDGAVKVPLLDSGRLQRITALLELTAAGFEGMTDERRVALLIEEGLPRGDIEPQLRAATAAALEGVDGVADFAALLFDLKWFDAPLPTTILAEGVAQLLSGKSADELRTLLAANDDLGQQEKEAALREPLFSAPPSAAVPDAAAPPPLARSVSLAMDDGAEDEGNMMACLKRCDAQTLCQLKAVSTGWQKRARRALWDRLLDLCSRQSPRPQCLDDVEELDVGEFPREAVSAVRSVPNLARLRGYGFRVELNGPQGVRQAALGRAGPKEPLGGAALRSCIHEGEGEPPHALLLAAVACAAPGTVLGVPVQRLRENNAIGSLNLARSGLGVISAELLSLMLPAATSVHTLRCVTGTTRLAHRAQPAFPPPHSSARSPATTPRCSLLSAPIDTPALTVATLPLARSLGNNRIGDEGVTALAAVLKQTKVTNLKCAAAPSVCFLLCQRPLTCLLTLPPPIPLQSRGKWHRAQGRLRARCYPQGDTDHQPRVRRRPRVFAFVSAPIDTLVSTAPRSHARSLRVNHLGPEGGAALAEGLKGNTTLRSLE